MGTKTRTIANNLTSALGSQAIGSVQQVHYKSTTSYSGAGRGSSHIISGLNMTFSRESQTSKTLLRYHINIGTQIDMWICCKIQYSTDGASFTDVPDITDSFGSNTSLPRGHIGNGYRAGGSNSFSQYTSNPNVVEYLHDTSGIASNTIYYRMIIFNGHGTHNRTIYINRAEDMSSTGDPNRNCGTSQLTAMEIL